MYKHLWPIGLALQVYHHHIQWSKRFKKYKCSNFFKGATVGQKIKKSPGQKDSWNQINQFHEIFLWPNSIFCNFKNGQKSIFELGKSLKLPKMQFHEKFLFIYLISRVIFAWTFLNHLVHCDTPQFSYYFPQIRRKWCCYMYVRDLTNLRRGWNIIHHILCI